MANKVLWKTGDTITADKLNGSGIYSIPLSGTDEEMTTPPTTAKDVLDAAETGKLICIVFYQENGEDGSYGYRIIDRVVKQGTTVYMEDGQNRLTATYPDGTFSSGDGESPK